MGGPPTGAIAIGLQAADGRVAEVTIANTRLRGAVGLTGVDATDVPVLVGTIYSLCGRAQTIASLRAVEAAAGLVVPDGVNAARDVLRLAEMLTQVAMRLALHWPLALGLPPEPALVRACMAAERQLEAALFAGSPWRVPGSGLLPDMGEAGSAIARIEDAVGAFQSATHLPGAIRRLGLEGFGALGADMPPEVGTFARRWSAPAVAEARTRHGAGLAARLTASLCEMATLPAEMRSALSNVAAAEPQEAPPATGPGEAVVETARGPLCHRVGLAVGKVADYAIDAPTEANFARGGPVEVGLLGAPAEGLELAARLHVLAIDPCVEFSVEVDHA